MPFGMIPFIKLVFLAFRQVSRPIADAAKNRAKTNPFFKNHICVPPAQGNKIYMKYMVKDKNYTSCVIKTAINRLEVRTKLWSRNLPIPLTIPELSEEAAIEVGSKLFGELFIFTIGAALLLWEYVRYKTSFTVS